MAERVGIFIDGPNLYGVARRLTGDGRVDIAALVDWLADGREVAEVAFWTGQLNEEVDAGRYAAQQRFFDDLIARVPNARIGRGHLQRRSWGWIEKGVDVGVALDLVFGAQEDRWDTAIAVTGDGDIARAGQFVRATGKAEVVSAHRSLSGLLSAQATTVRLLDAALIERLRYRR